MSRMMTTPTSDLGDVTNLAATVSRLGVDKPETHFLEGVLGFAFTGPAMVCWISVTLPVLLVVKTHLI